MRAYSTALSDMKDSFAVFEEYKESENFKRIKAQLKNAVNILENVPEFVSENDAYLSFKDPEHPKVLSLDELKKYVKELEEWLEEE